MATPMLPVAAAGALLVRMTAGLFSPPRVLLVPAGTRLPRGVHAVSVAAKPAATGSARRGAMRWALAAAAAPGESADDQKLQTDDAFYLFLEAKGAKAMEMHKWIGSPAGKATLIKDAVEKALAMAKAKEGKFDCVKALLLAIFGVIDLARESAPAKKAAAVDEQWFQIMLLSSRVHDDKAMMESINRALNIAAELLASTKDD